MKQKKILCLGVGNPGRQDDGLGPLFVAKLENKFLNTKTYDFETKYQLQIEDAELFSHYDLIYIIDASKEEDLASYKIDDVLASEQHPFSTHALNFEAVLYLAKDMFSFTGVVKVLSIKGYKFELKEALSNEARQNFDRAYTYFIKLFSSHS